MDDLCSNSELALAQNVVRTEEAASGDAENVIKQEEVAEEDEGNVDIFIHNVVCTFNTRCHLNLRQIALEGMNVEHRREAGKVLMRLRQPYTTASIWSSGKLIVTGATSEELAKVACKKYARALKRLSFKVHFANFKVVNVLGTCSMKFGIRLSEFTMENKRNASYEPELHPAVTYKMKTPCKATLKIFSTGSITVTAPSVLNVQLSIQEIFPLVHSHKMAKPNTDRNKVSDETDTEEEDDD